MRLQMFTVYDSKARAHITPWFLPELGMATRAFYDCVNDPEHQFAKHPGDYTLFHHGEFDQETGQIHAKETPASIGTGLEFKAKTVDNDQIKLEIAQ